MDLPVAQQGGAALISGPNAIIVGGQTASGVQATSVRANTAPQSPFFQLGLVGATVPGLTINGEIGQQLGYLNAAGVGTVNFILLLLDRLGVRPQGPVPGDRRAGPAPVPRVAVSRADQRPRRRRPDASGRQPAGGRPRPVRADRGGRQPGPLPGVHAARHVDDVRTTGADEEPGRGGRPTAEWQMTSSGRSVGSSAIRPANVDIGMRSASGARTSANSTGSRTSTRIGPRRVLAQATLRLGDIDRRDRRGHRHG